LVAIETGNSNLITWPNTVYNAVIDAENATISKADALIIISDYIISGGAVDEGGNSIYQGYLDFYDTL
jgi:hypothetical protein